MYKVIVQNECECFKKSDIENNQTFSSQTSAVMRAMKILNQMNSTFCNKHNFVLQESGDDYIIALNRSWRVVNCCGNGCCN